MEKMGTKTLPREAKKAYSVAWPFSGRRTEKRMEWLKKNKQTMQKGKKR